MVNHQRYNKRGWLRILEATIAVMIVSGVMVAFYSQQIENTPSSSKYFYDLQRQILSEIALRSDLRLEVLNTVADNASDNNFYAINNFVDGKIPHKLNYFLRICELNNTEDFCKMDTSTYIATQNKNIYAEDIIISSDLGNGTLSGVYYPKKVRLFTWRK